MTNSKTRSLQDLADDLKRVRADSNVHASTRNGLKLIDKRVEPITDGPSEDEFLRRGPNRFQRSLVTWLFGWFLAWRQRRRDEAQVRREMVVLHARMKTLLDKAENMRQTMIAAARSIAQQEARAQVRLAQLEKNQVEHISAINAQAEAIETLQNKVK